MRVGPCSAWVDQADVETVGKIPDDLTPSRIATLCDVATELLFLLSGRRYAGECTATVRPSRRVSGDGRRPSDFGDLGWYSPWGYHNINDHGVCGCSSPSSVTLGAYPVTAITEVLIDGEILDADTYEIRDNRHLVRTDGGVWPLCSGEFTVEFTYGSLPGPAGLRACAEYTRQLCLAETQDNRCQLPERVQTFTRQGVSAVIIDPQQFLENDLTGVTAVDTWLSALRMPRRTARVVSPDFLPATSTVTV